jgi:Sec-independent protein translocase protein TatA
MVFPRNALANIVIGAAVAVVGPKVLRPIIVGVVRAGYDVKDYASSAWTKAKAEATRVRDEATDRRDAAAATSEIQQLRDELNALKAAQAVKKTA